MLMKQFQNFNLIRNKKLEEMIERRTIIQKLDGKIRANSISDINVIKTIGILSNERDIEDLRKYKVSEYVLAHIRFDWLLEVSVEDGLIRIRDVSETDNWIKEMIENQIFIETEAFGYGNFEITCKSLGLEAVMTEEGDVFDWHVACRRAHELKQKRIDAFHKLYPDAEEKEDEYIRRLLEEIN